MKRKKEGTPNIVDKYLDGFDPRKREILEKVRALIKKEVPEAEETMSYGIPTYKMHGNLIHFGGFKHHFSLFPGPGAIDHFIDVLSGYKTSRGTVQFLYDDDFPIDLIEAITCFCVQERKKKMG